MFEDLDGADDNQTDESVSLSSDWVQSPGTSFAEAVEDQWDDYQNQLLEASMCEMPENQDGMHLNQDTVQMVQIAVETCSVGEPTVMVTTHLGETMSNFMTKLRNQLQIRMDQLLRVSFGCKTLKMEVTLAKNGLKEQELQLSHLRTCPPRPQKLN